MSTSQCSCLWILDRLAVIPLNVNDKEPSGFYTSPVFLKRILRSMSFTITKDHKVIENQPHSNAETILQLKSKS